MRTGDHECTICPHPFVNTMRILIMLFITLAFIFVLIMFNIRKSKESQFSIIGKIYMNYLHMVSTAFSFNISFPKEVYAASAPLRALSQTTPTLLSYDCFIEDIKIGFFKQSHNLNKSLLSCILPILVVSIFIALFCIIKLIVKTTSLKRNIVITLITVTYFFHPTLTQKMIGLFKCITI